MRIVTAIAFLICATLAANVGGSVWDGVYLDDQAARGKTLFTQQCAGCHGDSLAGKSAPPLAGDAFRGNWNGLAVSDLFDYVQKSMPRGKPGTLTSDQTADLLAFLFTSNGFPAGQKQLPTDSATLKSIRFSAAKTE